MKKLFALVLTLALVFAIAAPAMAATWGAPTANAGNPYVVSVTQLQGNVDTAGTLYFTAYPANLGVVAGTRVYFQVNFSLPTISDAAAYYAAAGGASNALAASVTVKNIRDVEVVSVLDDGVAMNAAQLTAFGAAYNSSTGKVSLPNMPVNSGSEVYTQDITVILKGYVKTTAEATVTGTMGYSTLTTLPVAKTISGVTYNVLAPSATPSNITATVGGTSTGLKLSTTSAGVVNGWTLTVGSTAYTVQAGPVFQFVSGNPGVITTLTDPSTLATVTAIYNGYVALLGFKAGDADIYYTTANILANFGYTNKATDSKTYKPYTTSLTVSDSTTVPNTGDAVSVLGFVMVGLALLATAAVVVKKVRA